MREMSEQGDAYSMALRASIARKKPVISRKYRQFIDTHDEPVRIEALFARVNVDVPPAVLGELAGDEVEVVVELVDGVTSRFVRQTTIWQT